ncbi:MAG: response regulator transcription factor [Bryobacteraceae bacterium]
MRPDDHPGAILVVDDDDFVRMLVKAFLERAGYTVLSATDGASGLDFFHQNRPAIALLLTDVAMPNMNGLDLADRVLEIDRKLPVLFMSGTAGDADRGWGCVKKPFLGSELLAKVGAALRHRAV